MRYKFVYISFSFCFWNQMDCIVFYITMDICKVIIQYMFNKNFGYNKLKRFKPFSSANHKTDMP